MQYPLQYHLRIDLGILRPLHLLEHFYPEEENKEDYLYQRIRKDKVSYVYFDTQSKAMEKRTISPPEVLLSLEVM